MGPAAGFEKRNLRIMGPAAFFESEIYGLWITYYVLFHFPDFCTKFPTIYYSGSNFGRSLELMSLFQK